MLRWPNGSKLRSLHGSTPAVILGQLLEVADQIKSVTITTVDKDDNAETFSSAMRLHDLAFHLVVHDEDIRRTMRGEIGEDVEGEAG